MNLNDKLNHKFKTNSNKIEVKNHRFDEYHVSVGTVVKLKMPCLGNPIGTLGVVYYYYGNGFQAIFENGSYDGFSIRPEKLYEEKGCNNEADFILERLCICANLENYKFKNVIQVDKDFRAGVFDVVLKPMDKGMFNL